MGRTARAVGGVAVQPLRRNVGGIGLEHQGLLGQGPGQLAYSQRALESHGPAEAELESQRDEMPGLHGAAVEGMGDTACDLDAAQGFEQRIG